MEPPLHGVLTALVTPFNRDQSIDVGALTALVQWQHLAGIHTLVPCGTSGEATSLSVAERHTVLATVAAQRSAAPGGVVAGVGAASTASSLEHLRRAHDAGATHALVAAPAYVKPSLEGLYRHFSCLADAALLPLVLYNVPQRTGCDLTLELLQRFAAHPHVIGLKDATADLSRLTAIQAALPHWRLLSGDDATACAYSLMGGHGVISVAANVVPAPMQAMLAYSARDALPAARHLHRRLAALFSALFVASNPMPVKAALAWLGKLQPVYRLPLCALSPAAAHTLEQALQDLPKAAFAAEFEPTAWLQGAAA